MSTPIYCRSDAELAQLARYGDSQAVRDEAAEELDRREHDRKDPSSGVATEAAR